MNVERLKMMIDLLETLSDDKFNIEDWSQDCGTVRCAVGWATVDPKFNILGLRSTNTGTPVFENRLYGPEAVRAFFELTREQSVDIFFTKGYLHLERKPMIKDIIEKIKTYISPKAACVLIMDASGKIVTVSRKNDHNDFGMPGGKVDPGEDELTSAVREVLEETGYDISSTIIEKPIHVGMCCGYKTSTFLAFLTKEAKANQVMVHESETGKVVLQDMSVLLTGSFAAYNQQVLNQL
ncbi:putative NUDIX hydrolase [Acinetobacter phage Ac42]|uniref:MutT/NUDIX hydrolase n=1 Tax=Acinetobacter phage Ac42 TaxID=762660 RepID=UPI0001EBCE01|nr:MutT/NUDIX hydrolase [Acinetobacter phage Ac42]ADI96453.1 putative NUDIX hydrolase [Acinetobacter phage Ac42]